MKTRRSIGAALICLQLPLALSLAHADGFRCGTWLVQLGETPGAVQRKCGAPEWTSRRQEWRGNGQGATTIVVDEWVFNFGSGKFMQLATFENGRLVSTTPLDYGR